MCAIVERLLSVKQEKKIFWKILNFKYNISFSCWVSNLPSFLSKRINYIFNYIFSMYLLDLWGFTSTYIKHKHTETGIHIIFYIHKTRSYACALCLWFSFKLIHTLFINFWTNWFKFINFFRNFKIKLFLGQFIYYEMSRQLIVFQIAFKSAFFTEHFNL